MTTDACRELARRPRRGGARARSIPPKRSRCSAHLDGCADCRAELRRPRGRSRGRSRSRIPSRVARAPASRRRSGSAAQVVDRVAFERARRAHSARPSGCGCWRLPRSSSPHSGSAARWSWPNATTRRRRRRVAFGPTTEASGGTAQLRAHAAGTEVDLVADGLDKGDYYWLWLTGDDGDRVGAGHVPRHRRHGPRSRSAAALPLDAARRIWVTDDSDKVVLDAHDLASRVAPLDLAACRRTFLPSSSPTAPSRCARSSSTSGASTGAARRCARCTRPPSSTGAAIIQAYKELQLGIVITVDENTQNCNLLKAPPFSSFPSQVRAYIDDEFHSFVGCASEAVAFSHMPPFKDKTVRLESHCACCLAPVTLVSKNFELQSVTPPGVFLHISLSPVRLEQRRHGADVRLDELRHRRRARGALREADLDARRAREPRPGEDVRAERRQRAHVEPPLEAGHAEPEGGRSRASR